MTNQDPCVALACGYHRLTREAFRAELRARLEAQPHVAFGDMQPERVYYCPKPPWGQPQVWVVTRVTPSGKQAQVRAFSPSPDAPPRPMKLYAAHFPGERPFRELPPEFYLHLIYLTHAEIVAAAVQRGLTPEVPAEVRREYPGLFVEVPSEWFPHVPRLLSGDDRLTHDLCELVYAPGGHHLPGPRDVDRWIEHVRRTLTQVLDAVHTRRAEPRVAAPGWVEQCLGYIEYYQWLRVQVSEGGPFYISGLPEPGPEPPELPRRRSPAGPLGELQEGSA